MEVQREVRHSIYFGYIIFLALRVEQKKHLNKIATIKKQACNQNTGQNCVTMALELAK